MNDIAAGLARLRIGKGPWGDMLQGPSPWSKARASFRTDVLIVGAGITGSLMAQHLASQGKSVALVDRLAPGQGSTAASTAMLQWEIDTSLVELSGLYGFEKAAGIYRQSFAAVQGLGKLVDALGIDCDYSMRSAVMLAADGDSEADIEEEFAARQAADFPCVLLPRARLIDAYGIDRAAAIVSAQASEADPLKLANALLRLALKDGARLLQDEVIAYDFDARRARVGLASGIEIEAGHLILATGYAMPPFVDAKVHRMSASWAAVTPQGTALGFWRDRSLIWEDDTPYLYARTTADDRILVGGEDEAIDDPIQRDAVAPEKAAKMHAKLEKMWGLKLAAFETVWSAAFSETEDGMPLIGPVPGCPNAYAAYGYGGNGITYSFLASRMIAEMIAGRRQPWFESFAIDRPCP